MVNTHVRVKYLICMHGNSRMERWTVPKASFRLTRCQFQFSTDFESGRSTSLCHYPLSLGEKLICRVPGRRPDQPLRKSRIFETSRFRLGRQIGNWKIWGKNRQEFSMFSKDVVKTANRSASLESLELKFKTEDLSSRL